jgi:hypothetical protein
MNMTDYGKVAVEYALRALTDETEHEVLGILQDGYTSFHQLLGRLNATAFSIRNGNGFPAMREDLAAVVLYAAAIIYEWEKSRPGMVSTDNLWKSTD